MSLITPILPQTIRNIIDSLKDPAQSYDGSGTNVYNFVLAAGASNELLLQRNTGRKSMTVINLDTTLTVEIVKFINGLEQTIPIPPLSSVEFRPIKVGEIVQCQDIELHQDLLVCEYGGELRMNNAGATDVDIAVFEAAF